MMQTCKVRGIGLAILLNGCGLFEPKFENERNSNKDLVGALQLALDPGGLGLMATEATSARIRIFRVAGEDLTQEGEDHNFPIDDEASSATMTIADITIGPKEIQVDIVNAASEVLGEGKARLTVVQGLQVMPTPIEIHLVDDAQRYVDLTLSATVTLIDNGEALTTYREHIKPLFDSQCTAACHNAAFPAGDLRLDVFPFTSAKPQLPDLAAIADLTLRRMEDHTMPMPPAGLLPSDKIQLMKDWIADGLKETRPSNSTPVSDVVDEVRVIFGSGDEDFVLLEEVSEGQYRGTSPGMTRGQSYTLAPQCKMADGSTWEGEATQTHARPDQAVEFQLAIPYSTPTLQIPIVIKDAAG